MPRPASSGQSAPKPSGTRPNGHMHTSSPPKDRSQSIMNSAKKGKK